MPEKLNNDELFIVNRMIDGDKQAFKYFFEKYYTELCNFVNVYLKDTNLSEEVVQDIFVYFWENKSRINVNSSVRSYLFGASKYRSLNVLRDKKREHRYIDLQSSEKLAISNDNPIDSFDNTDELQRVLNEAVEQLPDRCKEIFLLSKRNELSNKEIAVKMNISVKTVENQMTIALKKLRTALAPFREKLFLLFLIDFFIK